jgi:hypothetical protein
MLILSGTNGSLNRFQMQAKLSFPVIYSALISNMLPFLKLKNTNAGDVVTHRTVVHRRFAGTFCLHLRMLI